MKKILFFTKTNMEFERDKVIILTILIDFALIVFGLVSLSVDRKFYKNQTSILISLSLSFSAAFIRFVLFFLRRRHWSIRYFIVFSSLIFYVPTCFFLLPLGAYFFPVTVKILAVLMATAITPPLVFLVMIPRRCEEHVEV